LAVVLFASCTAGPKKVTIGTNAAFPPMEYLEKQTIVGFEIDLISAIAKAAGFETTFQSVSWDKIFSGLERGDYDAVVSSVAITPVRQATYDFSNSYFNAGQITVVALESGATELTKLGGKPVGVLAGTAGASAVEAALGKGDEKTYDEIGQAFEDLFNRRLAGLVVDLPVAVQYVLRNEKYKDSFKMIGEPLTDENYGVVVKKGNTELLALINAGLEKIKADGTYDKIKAQWLQ
jgi:polar amino acid transport system substrate-binding protein